MYPAGRILHLVPARLVFDAEQLAKLGETLRDREVCCLQHVSMCLETQYVRI